MDRKKYFQRLISTLIFLFIIGSFFSSFPFGRILGLGGQGGLEGFSLEEVLDTVNLWMGFIVFGIILIFLIYRAFQDEKYSQLFTDWEKKLNEREEEDK